MTQRRTSADVPAGASEWTASSEVSQAVSSATSRVVSSGSSPVEAIEAYYARGWTDGLPVVPPTRESVRAMLAAGGLAPGESLGALPLRRRVVSAEKVAINAVMAGCRPEYFPVVAAAVRALCHPDFAYHGPASSTGGSALVLIVNGPIARHLGINAGNNAFGQGWRPNATIGRAVRLTMMNVLETRPGQLDRATLGSPGKYTFCFAEDEAASPWEPLHVERGLDPGASAVTIYASNSLCQVYNQLSGEPEPLLRCLAAALYHPGVPNVRGFNQSLVVMAGEHAAVFRAAGWGKARIREQLVATARSTVADLKRAGRLPGAPSSEDERTFRYAFESPDDILLVRAGGAGGSWSACLPGWGKKWTRAVTIPVVGSSPIAGSA